MLFSIHRLCKIVHCVNSKSVIVDVLRQDISDPFCSQLWHVTGVLLYYSKIKEETVISSFQEKCGPSYIF